MNSRQESATMFAAGVAALFGAAFVFKGFEHKRQESLQSSCLSNLKQIGLATMQYVRDYDEQMPRAANWSAALFPYSKNTAIFQCPRRGNVPQGYALHRNASMVSQAAFNDPAKMVLYFDSDGAGVNSSDVGTSLPRRFRHPAGFGLGFADGHVKVVARPDLKFGYDTHFDRANAKAQAESAKFWAEYQKKQRTLQRRKIASQKKGKKP